MPFLFGRQFYDARKIGLPEAIRGRHKGLDQERFAVVRVLVKVEAVGTGKRHMRHHADRMDRLAEQGDVGRVRREADPSSRGAQVEFLHLPADAFAHLKRKTVEGGLGVSRVAQPVDRNGRRPHVVPDEVVALYVVGYLEIGVDFGDVHIRILSGEILG